VQVITFLTATSLTVTLERSSVISNLLRDVTGDGEAARRSPSVTIPTSLPLSITGSLFMRLLFNIFMALKILSLELMVNTWHVMNWLTNILDRPL
jgi:hypothetical protein